MTRKSILFWLFLLVFLAAFCPHDDAQACAPGQKGNPVIYGTCAGPTNSTAYIDASVFVGSLGATDICTVVNNILKGSYGSYAAGTVVDARGILPTPPSISDQCLKNPFDTVGVPSTVLLPSTTITINAPWVLPSGTRLLGGGTPPSGAGKTASHATLQVATGFTASSMIQMCDIPPCTGITVEHLTLDAEDSGNGPHAVNGIYNWGAGAASYVDDVNLDNFELTGILVSSNAPTTGPSTGIPYANQSGPYTNINYSAYYSSTNPTAACSTSGCPACVTLMAQTLGVDSITCIGAPVETVLPTHTPPWTT